MNTKVPVVVIHRSGTGSLGIARTLGRLRIRTYLIAEKEPSPVASSRYWTKRYWWDFSTGANRLVEFLLRVRSEIGGRPILLTTSDQIAIFIEENASVLKDNFIFPASGAPVVRTLLNKWEMFLAAQEHGIPTPKTAYPQSRTEAIQFLDAVNVPIVLKPADPSLPATATKEILYTRDEVLQRYDRAARSGCANLILQEYIPGNADAVWMCNAYFGRGSECLAVFSGRKLRQTSSTGIASLAVCEPNHPVQDATRRFMQAAGYEGPVGIGYRYDARDGSYKILDVNARVSGVFRLFRATNGLDVVRICYLDLTGQNVPAAVPAVGRKWMLEEDLISSFKALASGTLSLGQWVRSVRGVKETAWFAPDDPLPGFVWLWCDFCARIVPKARRLLLPRLRIRPRTTKA